MHQRAHISTSGMAGVRTGATASASRNRLTTAAAYGSTRRSRIVRLRVPSTAPKVLHQTGCLRTERPMCPRYRRERVI